MILQKSKAFTLMEIMIVLFIIGFILAFIGPRITSMFFKTEIAATKLKMENLKNALAEYKLDMGHYPTKQEGGLNALINNPGSDRWEGPYVNNEEDLEDKWGDRFEYNKPPLNYKKFRYFELISSGGEEADAKEIADGV